IAGWDGGNGAARVCAPGALPRLRRRLDLDAIARASTKRGVGIQDVAFLRPTVHGGDDGSNAIGRSRRATAAVAAFAGQRSPLLALCLRCDALDQLEDVALTHVDGQPVADCRQHETCEVILVVV